MEGNSKIQVKICKGFPLDCNREFQGPRSGLKVGGGLKVERRKPRCGSGGLPPENFLRPRPLERRKTPLSKKDVLIYVHIKIQFLSEKRQGTIKRDTYRENY